MNTSIKISAEELTNTAKQYVEYLIYFLFLSDAELSKMPHPHVTLADKFLNTHLDTQYVNVMYPQFKERVLEPINDSIFPHRQYPVDLSKEVYESKNHKYKGEPLELRRNYAIAMIAELSKRIRNGEIK